MKSKSKGRQGKHRDDKFRVQAYYEAQDKALFVLVAKLDGKSLTDTIKSSIRDRARALGVLDKNGCVTKSFKDALEVETAIIQQTEHNKKGKSNED